MDDTQPKPPTPNNMPPSDQAAPPLPVSGNVDDVKPVGETVAEAPVFRPEVKAPVPPATVLNGNNDSSTQPEPANPSLAVPVVSDSPTPADSPVMSTPPSPDASTEMVGQPLPANQAELEKKAQEMITELDKTQGGGPKKSKALPIVLGILGLFVLGGGLLLGLGVFKIPGVTNVQQQAAFGKVCSQRTQSECEAAPFCMDEEYKCRWDSGLQECKKEKDVNLCGGGGGGGICPPGPDGNPINCCDNAAEPCNGNVCLSSDYVVRLCHEAANPSETCWDVVDECENGDCLGDACGKLPPPGGDTDKCTESWDDNVTDPTTQCVFNPWGTDSDCTQGTKCTPKVCAQNVDKWIFGTKQWIPDWEGGAAACGSCPWNVPAGQPCCPDATDSCDPTKDEYLCIPDPFVSKCNLYPDQATCPGDYWWQPIVHCTEESGGLNNPLCAQYCGATVCGGSCVQNSDCNGNMICDSASGTCRNASCVEEEDCSCNQPEPTPTPGVTPTPSAFVCSDLAYTPANPTLGQTVTLTCSGTPAAQINHADFRYRINGADWIDLAPSSSLQTTFTVTDPGTHTVQCRVCESSDSTQCSPYEQIL